MQMSLACVVYIPRFGVERNEPINLWFFVYSVTWMLSMILIYTFSFSTIFHQFLFGAISHSLTHTKLLQFVHCIMRTKHLQLTLWFALQILWLCQLNSKVIHLNIQYITYITYILIIICSCLHSLSGKVYSQYLVTLSKNEKM